MSDKPDDRLTAVLNAKRAHVAERKAALPLRELERRGADAEPARGFADALRRRVSEGRYALIAEIKKASPSRGLIRAEFDPAALAVAYARGGACCLSVLTDQPFFQGGDEHLALARQAAALPVLRKDFIVDPYQVPESRAFGADCVLLIMAAVDEGLAREVLESAAAYGMDVLVEVHDRSELDRALALSPGLLGINNRNLKTLQVDPAVSLELATYLPPNILGVGESGLSTPADLARLAVAGIASFLIGESLLRHEDVSTAVQSLLVDRP